MKDIVTIKTLKRRLLSLHIFLVVVAISMIILPVTQAFAQAKTIQVKGIVTDAVGDVLPGVAINIQGTTVGVLSNKSGEYVINAPTDATLIFSFVGYETQKIKIKNNTVINAIMHPKTMGLDQVVVVAYGTKKKGDLTGSVGQVDVKDISKAPVSSISDALAGRVAGLKITSNDGQPGHGTNISIRGIGSLTQNTDPLFVVDGFPMPPDFDLSFISPDDVESITVLKDASATAIYGARAGNGVIVIETKKAKLGKPRISFSTSLGFDKVTKRMDMMDAYEFVKFQLERFPEVTETIYFPEDFYPVLPSGETPIPGAHYFPEKIPGAIPVLDKYKNTPSVNWQDKLLRTGITQIYNLSLMGGTNGTKYNISGSYFNQDGTVMNTQYDRYKGRIAFEQVISKKLTSALSIYYNHNHASGIVASGPSLAGNATSFLFYSAWGYRPVAGSDSALALLESTLVDPMINPATDYRLNPVLMAKK